MGSLGLYSTFDMKKLHLPVTGMFRMGTDFYFGQTIKISRSLVAFSNFLFCLSSYKPYYLNWLVVTGVERHLT